MVVEEPVELDAHYDVQIDDSEEAAVREARIIWVQDEADGQIIGVQFLDTDGTLPPPPSSPSNDRPSAPGDE